jgi:biotin carboxyl carrier protein
VSGAAEDFESDMAQPARAEPGEVLASGDAADEAARPDGMILVHAPMMGTFYRGASPQDPPFVEVGDRVAPGDPLCLIEVMKLFTTIDAEQAGRIVEIGAENEAEVAHDQLLFVIDPA